MASAEYRSEIQRARVNERWRRAREAGEIPLQPRRPCPRKSKAQIALEQQLKRVLSDRDYWFQYVRYLLKWMDSTARLLEEAQDPNSLLSAEQRSEKITSTSRGLNHFMLAMRAMGIEPAPPSDSGDHADNSNHR